MNLVFDICYYSNNNNNNNNNRIHVLALQIWSFAVGSLMILMWTEWQFGDLLNSSYLHLQVWRNVGQKGLSDTDNLVNDPVGRSLTIILTMTDPVMDGTWLQLRVGIRLLVLLFLLKNTCCGYSLEERHQGAFNEYLQLSFQGEIQKY